MSELTAGWVPRGFCSLLVCDVVRFSDKGRSQADRTHIRNSLYEGLRSSFDQAGVGYATCYREDRGDGVMLAIPPTVDTAILLTGLFDELKACVRRHNTVSSAATRMQLRLAVHVGQVRKDEEGLDGDMVIHTHRILDAQPFKEALDASGADVALIVSDQVYRDVVRDGVGLIDPEDYRLISVVVKETTADAWIRVPGFTPGHAPPPRRPDLAAVVDRLLEIDLLVSAQGREQVVRELHPDIAGVIPRMPEARSDLHQILRTCLDYEGGLEQLLGAIHQFVGDSRPFREVQAALEQRPAAVTGPEPRRELGRRRLRGLHGSG
jgi:hypothetical protein